MTTRYIHREGPTEDIEEHCMPEPVEKCPAFVQSVKHLWSFPRNGVIECLFCGSKRRSDPSPN